MKHVLLQLLQNAIEAMPNGGNIKVQVCNYKEEYIKIKIIDSGTGISDERLKKSVNLSTVIKKKERD